MKPCYELRFFISPELALRIRDFVREYMDFDEHSVDQPGYSYPVHTIHLDSDDWKIYWRTVRGDQDRWKLRLRYYNNHPDSPVFCEVKRQMTDAMVKYRAGLRREAVDSVLAGHMPHPEQLLSQDVKQSMALERFLVMMLELNASPKLHVSCMREAYVTYDDGPARVTFDRRICIGEPSDDSRDLLTMEMDKPLMCADHTVILELRFVERFPDWYRELVRTFELSQPLLWKHNQGTISCAGLHLTPGDLIYNVVL